MNKKTSIKKEEDTISLEEAFVKENERVLDPSLIDKSVLERMPQPTGWRILVLPYRGKGITEGGILLTKGTIEKETLATVVAYVVAMGPDCYQDAKRFKDQKHWCEKGQWILIGRYAGSRFKLADDAEERAAQAETKYYSLQGEYATVKNKASVLDKSYTDEYESRVKSQRQQAEDLYRKARETNDPDLELKSVELLNKVSLEEERVRLAKMQQQQQQFQNEQLVQQNVPYQRNFSV
jgi:co-chaperonin GroES (HSP10)